MLFTCNTRDYVLRRLVVLCNYHCTLCRGVVGVADIYRNLCASYGEDCGLVEYRRTHIRQLTQFFICDRLDDLRLVNYSGVCDKEAVYVCPVLIKFSVDSLCNDRAGNIRTAS